MKRIFEYKVSKDVINYTIIIFTSVFLSILSLSSSPLWRGFIHNDYCVFEIMGKAFCNNTIIYKDLFDHKGPVIYAINAMGTIIDEQYGIFIIENTLVIIASIFIYKTAKLYLKTRYSLLVSIGFLMFLFMPISGGNYTEDYSCVFSAIAIYYILKMWKAEDFTSKKSWLIIGLTFALNLFIKPTYVSLWIALYITIAIKIFINKRFKDIINIAIYSFLGFIIIFLPIAIYMIINNCWKEFWEAYIMMNMKYSKSSIIEKIISFYYLIKGEYLVFLILAICGNVYIVCTKKIRKSLKSFIVLYFIITIILTAWAPNHYRHYLTQCATMLATNLIIIFYSIDILRKKTLYMHLIYLIIAIIIVVTLYIENINEFTCFNRHQIWLGEKSREALNQALEKIDPKYDDCISIGNYPYVYRYLGIYPKCKFFFQYPIGIYDKSVGKYVLDYIENEKPKLIFNGSIGYRDVKAIFGNSFFELMDKYYEEFDFQDIKYYVLK